LVLEGLTKRFDGRAGPAAALAGLDGVFELEVT